MGVNNYDDRNEGAARASQPAPAPPPSKDHAPLQAESERVRPVRPTPPAQSAIAKADARASEALEDPAAQPGSEMASEKNVTGRSVPLSRSGEKRTVSETHGTAADHGTVPPRTAAGH